MNRDLTEVYRALADIRWLWNSGFRHFAIKYDKAGVLTGYVTI